LSSACPQHDKFIRPLNRRNDTYYAIIPIMEQINAEQSDLKKMIADYMEGGFLDNIIDMFKHDKNLYTYVGELLTDERMRVRIGITALLETLKNEDSEDMRKAIPFILPLLQDINPVIRGDAAYLIGLIGNSEDIPALRELTEDENENVRSIVSEAIHDIQSNHISL
jgi:HEAT repeat protein